jgi:signal transduction histidine kinase
MAGRILPVLLCALAFELLGNVALYRWQERTLRSDHDIAALAQRLAAAEDVALAASPVDRGRQVQALDQDDLSLNWVPRTVIADYSASFAQLASLHGRIVHFAPRFTGRELRLTLMPSAEKGRRDLVGALGIDDGSYVTFRLSPYLGAPPAATTVVLLHLALTALVFGAALVMIRALVRPLRNLAEAADRTGDGGVGPIVAEGPAEVRRVATAFSAMQARLLKTMDDHTQALVAVSHDLRTPIQRLRLRASLLHDEEAQDAIGADLAEMESFIESTLSYFRSGEDEAPRLIDAAAMLSTIADAAADLGDSVDYRGPDTLPVMGRLVAIRRIVANLLDNARRHADHIELTLTEGEPGWFHLDVDDDGPGIPPARREEALLPFRRLDSARGQGGGAGLGLAAAHKSARVMGGTLTLGKSRLGGLRVRLTLPTG